MTDVSSSPETESVDVTSAFPLLTWQVSASVKLSVAPPLSAPPTNFLLPAPHTLHAPNSPLLHFELVSCQIVKPMRTGTLSF